MDPVFLICRPPRSEPQLLGGYNFTYFTKKILSGQNYRPKLNEEGFFSDDFTSRVSLHRIKEANLGGLTRSFSS